MCINYKININDNSIVEDIVCVFDYLYAFTDEAHASSSFGALSEHLPLLGSK